MATCRSVTVSSLKALKDDVIVRDMNFLERFSNSGIIIPSDNTKSSGVRPRWGKVYAVGPLQTNVAVGEYVLIAHGRWTRGVMITDSSSNETFMIQKIDAADILLVSDTEMIDETFSSCI